MARSASAPRRPFASSNLRGDCASMDCADSKPGPRSSRPDIILETAIYIARPQCFGATMLLTSSGASIHLASTLVALMGYSETIRRLRLVTSSATLASCPTRYWDRQLLPNYSGCNPASKSQSLSRLCVIASVFEANPRHSLES